MPEQVQTPQNDDLSAGLVPQQTESAGKKRRAAKPTKTTDASRPAPLDGDRVNIIIAESDNPKDTHVFVSVNGYAYNIKRGQKVSVPQAVVHVLENAVESRLVQLDGGRHELKSYQRFPFQTVQ